MFLLYPFSVSQEIIKDKERRWWGLVEIGSIWLSYYLYLKTFLTCKRSYYVSRHPTVNICVERRDLPFLAHLESLISEFFFYAPFYLSKIYQWPLSLFKKVASLKTRSWVSFLSFRTHISFEIYWDDGVKVQGSDLLKTNRGKTKPIKRRMDDWYRSRHGCLFRVLIIDWREYWVWYRAIQTWLLGLLESWERI